MTARSPHHKSPNRPPQTLRPKKWLGQHFLVDTGIAQAIVEALRTHGPSTVVEIGPGEGALTSKLLQREDIRLWAVEVDPRAVSLLRGQFPALGERLIECDVLKVDWRMFNDKVNVVGNFPYFISSQIFFKILSYPDSVSSVLCMLQKEVAQRIAAPSGNRVYGLLSVLLQAYYYVEVLFDVPPQAFYPKPKVNSAVIRLTRNKRDTLPCSAAQFQRVVKQAFQQRRKTLRNALKPLAPPQRDGMDSLLSRRAEQLSVDEFLWIAQQIEQR